MRTTLNIEDDILATVKELAQKERVSTGKILSRLAREALTSKNFRQDGEPRKTVAGFRPFPPREEVISNDQIDTIRDEEGL
jgi:hypothetical protein